MRTFALATIVAFLGAFIGQQVAKEVWLIWTIGALTGTVVTVIMFLGIVFDDDKNGRNK